MIVQDFLDMIELKQALKIHMNVGAATSVTVDMRSKGACNHTLPYFYKNEVECIQADEEEPGVLILRLKGVEV